MSTYPTSINEPRKNKHKHLYLLINYSILKNKTTIYRDLTIYRGILLCAFMSCGEYLAFSYINIRLYWVRRVFYCATFAADTLIAFVTSVCVTIVITVAMILIDFNLIIRLNPTLWPTQKQDS